MLLKSVRFGLRWACQSCRCRKVNEYKKKRIARRYSILLFLLTWTRQLVLRVKGRNIYSYSRVAVSVFLLQIVFFCFICACQFQMLLICLLTICKICFTDPHFNCSSFFSLSIHCSRVVPLFFGSALIATESTTKQS